MDFKNVHKKKVNVFGKKISLLLIVAVAAIGVAAAALIPYFASITGNVVVSQGLTVDGNTWNQAIPADTLSMTSLQSDVAWFSHTMEDNANTNANVVLDTECSTANTTGPNDCSGITYLPLVQSSVRTFNSSNSSDDPFASATYRKIYYDHSGVGTLGDLKNVTYLYNFTANNGWSQIPYVVIKTTNFPDGIIGVISGDSTANELNSETVNGASKFWTPGNNACPQSSPCTLTSLETSYGSDSITELSLAIGASSGTGLQTASVLSGIQDINGVPAQMQNFTVLSGETVPFVIYGNFPKMLQPDTYTLTTTVNA